MGRFRTYSAGSKHEFKLFDTNTTLGWKVIRRISEDHGEDMVLRRKARHVVNSEGKHIGYQMYESALRPTPVVQDSKPSCTSISKREMEANAGLFGLSRTASMSEAQRIKRVARGRPEMDLVEAARVKLDAYCGVH